MRKGARGQPGTHPVEAVAHRCGPTSLCARPRGEKAMALLEGSRGHPGLRRPRQVKLSVPAKEHTTGSEHVGPPSKYSVSGRVQDDVTRHTPREQCHRKDGAVTPKPRPSLQGAPGNFRQRVAVPADCGLLACHTVVTRSWAEPWPIVLSGS